MVVVLMSEIFNSVKKSTAASLLEKNWIEIFLQFFKRRLEGTSLKCEQVIFCVTKIISRKAA